MTIQRLDERLARKIAAGEVIERPASVVKELLENALDAGSERIEVELVDGGIRAIVVRDDGVGMTEDDLRLCAERHATSKIAEEADLDTIHTLGFRGEALASIAAVSRLRIVARARGETDGYALRAEAGRIEEPLPAGRAPGTTVEVEDLFFNLPARARFLGSPRTEFTRASRVVQRLALASPAVGWSLRHRERSVFEAPKATDLVDRIAQIYGAEIARAMVPLEGVHRDVCVRGFVSRPDVKRGNRRDQLFCVNGRPIADRALSYVLASATHGILRPGSHPIAVILVELPPERVDVNVHPRKEEVRFRDPRAVRDAVAASLQAALASRYVASGAVSWDRRPSKLGGADRVRETPSSSALPLDLRQTTDVRRAVRDAEKVRVLSDRRVVGQLHHTYLLVEAPDGLEIVDQHIAHERSLFERLKAQLSAGDVARQQFLLPVRIELPLESAAILQSAGDELAGLGVVLDEFGGGTFLLREYPTLLAESQSRLGFQELFEGIVEVLSQGAKLQDLLADRLLSELACRAAIRAGERLSLEEQQHLVEHLMTLDNPYFCPHGRPIVSAIARDDLDRRFKRT